MAEDAVDGGAGAAHVRPDGSCGPKLLCDLAAPGRRGQVVGRERSKVARPPAALERVEEGKPSILEAGSASELVEAPVDLSGGRLRRAKGQGDDKPVVLG